MISEPPLDIYCLSPTLPNLRYAVESSVRLSILSIVEEAAEDEHAHEDKGEEEAQVLVAGLHRVHDRLEADGSSCQFEHTHDPGDSKNLTNVFKLKKVSKMHWLKSPTFTGPL